DADQHRTRRDRRHRGAHPRVRERSPQRDARRHRPRAAAAHLPALPAPQRHADAAHRRVAGARDPAHERAHARRAGAAGARRAAGQPGASRAAGGDRMSARWRLAVSTLGAVEESLADVAALLARHGIDAVELRTADDAPVHVGLTARERAEVRATFADAGVGVLTVASRVKVASPDPGTTASLRRHLELTADLGGRYVRVFPGAPAAPVAPDELPPVADVEAADTRAAEVLAATAAQAADLGVGVLVETHASPPRGRYVARGLDRVADHPSVGAIWDLLHPWRVGEALEESADHLLPYLLDDRGYVQIKDVPSRQDTT